VVENDSPVPGWRVLWGGGESRWEELNEREESGAEALREMGDWELARKTTRDEQNDHQTMTTH
jgi:hypothetical protein